MNKREQYNCRTIRKYRNRKHLKNLIRDIFIMAGLIFFTLAIAEPYSNEGLDLMIIRMCGCFLLGGVMFHIAGKINRKKIKPPTITHKRPLTDRSKEYEEILLKYEIIPEPETKK